MKIRKTIDNPFWHNLLLCRVEAYTFLRLSYSRISKTEISNSRHHHTEYYFFHSMEKSNLNCVRRYNTITPSSSAYLKVFEPENVQNRYGRRLFGPFVHDVIDPGHEPREERAVQCLSESVSRVQRLIDVQSGEHAFVARFLWYRITRFYEFSEN